MKVHVARHFSSYTCFHLVLSLSLPLSAISFLATTVPSRWSRGTCCAWPRSTVSPPQGGPATRCSSRECSPRRGAGRTAKRIIEQQQHRPKPMMSIKNMHFWAQEQTSIEIGEKCSTPLFSFQLHFSKKPFSL